MLQVSPTTGPVRRGECYVRVTLLMAGFAVGRLIAGYVTDGATLAWPGGKFENFTDGSGLIRTIVGTDPAAGAEILETVPTNARWRLLSIFFRFVTSATVADRKVQLRLLSATDLFMMIASSYTEPASQGPYYIFFAGAPKESAGVQNTIGTPLPQEVILAQGWRITTSTTNIQADDDYGPPYLVVEEWIEE